MLKPPLLSSAGITMLFSAELKMPLHTASALAASSAANLARSSSLGLPVALGAQNQQGDIISADEQLRLQRPSANPCCTSGRS